MFNLLLQRNCLKAIAAFLVSVMTAIGAGSAALAIDGPKTPVEWATRYMADFNMKDFSAIKKARYPSTAKSEMQEMIDGFTEAGMTEGTKFVKYDVLPADDKLAKPTTGMDGKLYQASVPPTNQVKFSSGTVNGAKTDITVTIGKKDGIYFEVCAVPASGPALAYAFGWQRFSPIDAGWSVLMPNEPEPGRAAIEKDGGKAALSNPDSYGVEKNTASIKTTRRFYTSGTEGKRLFDDANKETYTAACTTYAPETLKEWFSDGNKNLDDAIDFQVREENGNKLVRKENVTCANFPGREFEVQRADGSVRIGRICWGNDRLYELFYTSKGGKPDTTSCNKFITSIQFGDQ